MSKPFATLLLLAAVAACGAAAAGPLRAGDWPQILGPQRNGAATDEQLLERWPQEGPRQLWTYPLGAGYSGAAVAGDKAIVFHRKADFELLEALDVRSGRRLWKASFAASYRGGVNPDRGPRCVPVIHDGRVYAFGAAGDLHCVTLDQGEAVWSQALGDELQAMEGYFGFGSTPVVAGGLLLVNVGGRDGAGLVALDLGSGRAVWQATDARASYSSPAIFSWKGQQRVLFVTRLHALAVDPANGRELFRLEFGQRGATVNAATPLVFNGRVFLSASYGVGARLLKLTDGQPQLLWSSDDRMSSQYTTCVHRDGYLYGVHGREDIGQAELRCLAAANGEVQWSVPNFGVAHLILAGDRLLIQKVAGELLLAEATHRGYRQLEQCKLKGPVCRALPALSNGRLFVRSHDGDRGHLQCLQVGR